MAAVTSGSSLYGSMLRRCLGACKQAVCDNAACCMSVEHKDGFVESARHSQACRNGTQHALHGTACPSVAQRAPAIAGRCCPPPPVARQRFVGIFSAVQN